MWEDREKLIDRIKKLLALSENNNSEGEAIAAALKAQKLISEYNIEQYELYEAQSTTIEEITTVKYVGKAWRPVLAAIIAENFRCKTFTQCYFKDDGKNGYVKSQIFVGYDCDARAAALVYERLADVGEQKSLEAARLAKVLYHTSEGAKTTFLLGFLQGVKIELEKQSQALLLVVPKDVIEKYENDYTFSGSSSWEPNLDSLDYTSEGQEAGKEAVRSHRLDGEPAEISGMLQ